MFKNMRVGVRLTIGFAGVLILKTMLAYIGIDRMQGIMNDLDEVSGLRMTRSLAHARACTPVNTGLGLAVDEVTVSVPPAAKQGSRSA
jgi:hypothetical protein